ncbi:MAG: 50S ribosomal protein L32 [Thermodesulfobacteriota bacterium]
MAVPKKKTSKSRKGMRRSHHKAKVPTVISCECGAAKLPHRVCPSCGNYKGKQMLGQVDGK